MARIRLAFVDVNATQIASESATLANSGRRSFFADATIFTWVGVAVVAVFAALTAQFNRALASEIVIKIVAFTRKQAG